MNILEQVDLLRIKANSELNRKTKSSLGQFFTPSPICLYMASLFNDLSGDIKLLDPGCGPGSLTAALVDEALRRGSAESIDIQCYDIEPVVNPYINESISLCVSEVENQGIQCLGQFFLKDFILDQNKGNEVYTHIIMNPPYKKILSNSDHRKALRIAGIETVNLYAGFVSLAIKQLAPEGELVAIIPRSFCNGPYYQAFRELILEETSIQHIHIFDSRSNAFPDDDVLQESVIIHLVKGIKKRKIEITSSPGADFQLVKRGKSITATDKTIRKAPFKSLVYPNDERKFIHIIAHDREQSIVNRLSLFKTKLKDLNVEVSTGPVVGFRMDGDLRRNIENDAAPLLYPIHLNGVVNWPQVSNKPNAIAVNDKTRKLLWKHAGYFIIVRRLSSKEEKRRIVATVYDSSLPGKLIGFENKLNVFHFNKTGLSQDTARGLYIYLNSTLLDKYYRLFGGNTQVNATDLKYIHYPSIDSLSRMGKVANRLSLEQWEIDSILEDEIIRLSGNPNNPLAGQFMIEQALDVLKALGMPREQQNERSALTLLALVNLHPDGAWSIIDRPMMGVTPIMAWCQDIYGKAYAPNTRETFRRQTLHQFVDGGLALYNPDKPGRPVNSPKACYQISGELLEVLKTYGTNQWSSSLAEWLGHRETLAAQYAMEREMEMIPLTLNDGTEVKLSPGIHSQLIHDIVTEFGPRFAPGSEVIYLGDTGAKEDFFKKERLSELGVVVNRKGKLPDVVLYWSEKDWLLLVESVTSHGPVDGKRHGELSKLFAGAAPGLVYVTAFPDRRCMTKYLPSISWETEVWAADEPTHMIHFNGDRFLGPHE